MKRHALTSVVLMAFAIVSSATAAPNLADTESSPDDELARDLESLQGTWELVTGKVAEGAATSRSVKTISGNRETVRRYRLPSGELTSEHTVEFSLSASGGVRVFTFFPIGGTPQNGRSYVYRIYHDDFFDVPGLLADESFDNYQVLPKVWHWKRVAPDKASEAEMPQSNAEPTTLNTQGVNGGRIVQRRSGMGTADETCSAQPCSSWRWENRGFDSTITTNERGTRSVCRYGEVDGSPSPGSDPGDDEAGGL